MKIRGVILLLIYCFVHGLLHAQAIIDIGAIIETESHSWTLKSISRYNDSLVVNWIIKSKKPNTKTHIDTRKVLLIDYHTKVRHKPLHSLSQTEFEIVKAFDTDTLRTVFPAIKDTASLVSVRLSSVLSVDSIILPPSNLSSIGEVRYKVPFCNRTLKNRIDSVLYSDSLFSSGMDLYKSKQYQDATICFEKCYAFDKLLDNYIPLFSSLKREYNDHSGKWLARCLYKIGAEDQAKTLSSDYLLEPFDRKLVEKSDSIYNILNALSYKPNSEKEHLLSLQKICEYDSAALGVRHHRYALSLYELGQAYSSYRHFTKAKEIFQKSYDIIVRLSVNNWLGKSVLSELAKIAYQEENYFSAIKYMEQSLGIENDSPKFSEENIISTTYSTLAGYYLKAGNWEKALDILKNKMLYWREQNQDVLVNNLHYESALDSYASILAEAGKSKEALRVYKHLTEINKSKWRLVSLGTLYYNIKDYQSALKCYYEALCDSSTLSTENCLNSLAICYSAMGEYKKAIQTQKECISKTNPALLTYSNIYNGYASYTTELSNLASFFNWNEQHDSALVYEKKSLELKKKYFSPHHESIAYSHINLGVAYGGLGNLNEAISHLIFSYDIYKNQRRSRFRQRVLSYLSKYSFCLNEIDNLNKYIAEYMISASEDLLSSFQELTYDERSRYIEDYSNILNREIPTYAYYTHSDSIIEAAYNASLMMKGALLNSENSVKRVIEESKNDTLINLWAELKADKYILAKNLEKDSLYRKINADSLQKVIYHLEDSLIVKCKEYGDITRSMKLKWKDIQHHLAPNDIALEFLSFPTNNDSIVYVALSLRKDSEYPKMITLFEGKQLTGFQDSLHYQCKEMTDLVWKPLKTELEGIKNIYFSPSGALYNIGIEYLPGMEDYNIYRLSSTRELITGGKTETKNRAVLYGGLRYDAGFDKSATEKSIAILDEVFKERANVRGMGLRGGKEYLKHTKEEVDIIGEELNKANWKCVLDSAAMGTEESFKALSGRKIGCLHISTHGFYYNKEEADNARYKFMLIDNCMVSAEDKALTRSGLVMSGANHILEDEKLPDNVEDGILTAKEIADVDLRGLDLVVLSACQTGLGDIAQGEGVFGLQRGFKKAGANSILMSLWEVEDKATQILMTQFYRNLLSGQSKRQSLLSAQKYLREVDGGRYDEPKYWAAFVLLDAIN